MKNKEKNPIVNMIVNTIDEAVKKSTDKKFEKIINEIQELLNNCSDTCGERQNIARHIILEATIWGARNTYEGMGLLEISKMEYKELCEEVLNEEN